MTRQDRLFSSPSHWLGAASLAVVTLVYFRLTRVYFWSDDYSALVMAVDHGFARFFLQPIAGHVYYVRNLFFLTPYWLFGFRSEPYGWMALAIQLVNTALLFRVTHRFTGSPVLAALGAILWGACPVHAGAIGWFTVHGHTLAVTATLVALDRVEIRDGEEHLSLRNAKIAAVAMWLGATCSGGGTAMALVIPVVLLALIRPANREGRAGLLLLAVVPVTLATYLGATRLYVHLYGPLPAQEGQVFPIALLNLKAVVAAQLGLVQNGAIALPLRLFRPGQATPLQAHVALGLCGALVLLGFLLGDRATRRRAAAAFLTTMAMYATVAFGRAAFSRPGELPGEPRYHYAGSLFLTLLLMIALSGIARRLRLPRGVPVAALAAWALSSLSLHLRAPWKLDTYDYCRDSVEKALARIDAAISASLPGSPLTLPNEDVGMCFMYSAAGRSAGVFALARQRQALTEHRVRFVTDQAYELLWSANPARRMSGLFVPAPGASIPTLGLPSQGKGESPEAVCADYLARAEEVGTRLGCHHGWFTRRAVTALCLATLSDWRCPGENERLGACLREHVGDLVCDENGGLGIGPAACGEATMAVLECSARKAD